MSSPPWVVGRVEARLFHPLFTHPNLHFLAHGSSRFTPPPSPHASRLFTSPCSAPSFPTHSRLPNPLLSEVPPFPEPPLPLPPLQHTLLPRPPSSHARVMTPLLHSYWPITNETSGLAGNNLSGRKQTGLPHLTFYRHWSVASQSIFCDPSCPDQQWLLWP